MKLCKLFLVTLTIGLIAITNAKAQCPESADLNTGIVPEDCTPTAAPSAGAAINLTPFFTTCQSVCFGEGAVNNGGGGVLADCADGGPSNTNDMWLYAADPYTGGNPYGIPGTGIAGYDGSLVISWKDFPGYPDFPPTLSIHYSVATSFGGVVPDCTDGFTASLFGTPIEGENLLCENALTLDNNQLIAPPGTIPLGSAVNAVVSYINYYIQVVPNPAAPAGSNYCIDVSSYTSGFICGDPTNLTLASVTPTQSTASSAAICLCSNAANGGLWDTHSNNTANPGVVASPCGTSSSSTAWFKMTAPYGCNRITANVTPGAGVSGNFNIAILSNVSCVATTGTNPVTGDPVTAPQDSINTDFTVEAQACGLTTVSSCSPLPAGDYWIAISHESDRITFGMDVVVDDLEPNAGTLADATISSICNGGDVAVSTTGSYVPNAGAPCNQDINWLYSTTAGFDPATAGTNFGTGTSATFTAPAVTGCTPQTYYLVGYVESSATCKSQTAYKQVVVYPDLDATSYLMALTLDGCGVTYTPNCAGNLIDGAATYTATAPGGGTWTVPSVNVTNPAAPAGTSCATFTIPSQDFNCTTVTCTTPLFSPIVTCDPTGLTYSITVTIDPTMISTYDISDNDAITPYSGSGIAPGASYVMGPYDNNTSVVITVTDAADATCTANSLNLLSNCICATYSAIPVTAPSVVCSGADATLTANVDNPSNYDLTYSWVETSSGAVIGTTPSITVNNTNTTCTNITVVYELTITHVTNTNCLDQIVIPSIDIEPAPSPIVVTNTGCNIVVGDANCPGLFTISGGNTSPNVYDAVDPSSGTVSFTFTPAAGSVCSSATLDVPYACGAVTCPTFVSAQSSSITGFECSGNTVDLSVTLAPAVTDYTINWTGPDGFTSTEQNPTVTLSNIKCFTDASVYNYEVYCSDGTLIQSGAVLVNVGPDPDFEVFGINSCEITVNSLCIGEEGEFNSIYWGALPANGNVYTAAAGSSGAVTYTMVQTNGCTFTQDFNYDCSGGVTCIVGADGVCTLDEHSRVLPFVCVTETSGIEPSVALYDALTGAGMYVAAGYEVGFIITNSNTYTAADFSSGIAPIISYSGTLSASPNPTGNIGSDSIAAIYQNATLWVYAISLQAPFSAFNWATSTCAKVSAPAQVTFLRPLSASTVGSCLGNAVSFSVTGGLYSFDGTLPTDVSLTDATGTIFTPASVTASGSDYIVNFNSLAGAANPLTLNVTDQNLCRVSTNVTCIVPLQLLKFDGLVLSEYNQLQWMSGTEIDMNRYEIERSFNGLNFETIDYVNAKGNSVETLSYSWNDNDINQSAYYRLKMQGNDVTDVSYSKIIYLQRNQQFENVGLVGLFPVPTQNTITLQFVGEKEQNVMINIVDISGKSLFNKLSGVTLGRNDIVLDLSKLSKGLYFVEVLQENGMKQSAKIVIN